MSLIRIPPRLNLLAICGLGALGLGATGQGGLLCPWAREHHLVWALLALLLIPLLLVWFGNFTKVSPLSAAANGTCALYAVANFAAFTLAEEAVLWTVGAPAELPASATIAFRVLMHLGWLGVPPLLFFWRGMNSLAEPSGLPDTIDG